MSTALQAPRPAVAAWDFDETITTRDTLVGFLSFIAGKRAAAAALARHSPELAMGIRSSERRNEAKELVLADIMRGRHIDEVRHAGLQYAATLPPLFRRWSLERIAWHQDQGHRVVIVSASMVYYLRPIAENLGIDHVIAVEMEVGPDDRLTGALASPNVRKAEKARRLATWLDEEGISDAEIWAYGDSSGDDELLAMADHPWWIGKRAKRN